MPDPVKRALWEGLLCLLVGSTPPAAEEVDAPGINPNVQVSVGLPSVAGPDAEHLLHAICTEQQGEQERSSRWSSTSTWLPQLVARATSNTCTKSTHT